MNKTQIAILLVRLSAFQFVIYGLNFLTYLPERSFAANNFHSGTSATLAQMEIKMMIARSILHITLGVALWLFADKAAQIFTAGLETK